VSKRIKKARKPEAQGSGSSGKCPSQKLYSRINFIAGSTSKPSEPNLTDFHRFPDLPAELRCKIWTHASFIPRNIDIWTSDFGHQINIPTQGEEDPVEEFTVWKYCSRASAPALLSVCRESRVEALKYYKLDFDSKFSFRDFTFITTPRVYVNHESDRLCFLESFQGAGMWDCIDFFNRCQRNGIRSLALNIRHFQGGEPWTECDYIRPMITKFTDSATKSSIEEIILVNEYYHREAMGAIEFKDLDEKYKEGKYDDGKLLHGIRKWLVEQRLMADEKGRGYVKSGPKISLKYMLVGGERLHA